MQLSRKKYGLRITLVFSNEEIDYIIKIIYSLKDAGLFKKDVSETVENETKQQNGEFLGMLAATLVASLLENMLMTDPVIRGSDRVIRVGEWTIRAGQDF